METECAGSELHLQMQATRLDLLTLKTYCLLFSVNYSISLRLVVVQHFSLKDSPPSPSLSLTKDMQNFEDDDSALILLI